MSNTDSRAHRSLVLNPSVPARQPRHNQAPKPPLGALLASSEASRACEPVRRRTAEAKSPGFVHARARSRGRHRRASRTGIQRLRVSGAKSQETRLSPAASMPSGRPVRADPTPRLIYRVIFKPAVAEIVGDGRP